MASARSKGLSVMTGDEHFVDFENGVMVVGKDVWKVLVPEQSENLIC